MLPLLLMVVGVTAAPNHEMQSLLSRPRGTLPGPAVAPGSWSTRSCGTGAAGTTLKFIVKYRSLWLTSKSNVTEPVVLLSALTLIMPLSSSRHVVLIRLSKRGAEAFVCSLLYQ